ncbi:MAG: methyltransferase domain-containing protein [Ferruginibacter sp.]
MTTLDISLPHTGDTNAATPKIYSNIQDYYNIAGPDYEAWSPNFNMHFGYCKYFSDIFSLEKMLKRMNDEVLDRLQLPTGKKIIIADLGCGVGTVARHTAKKYTQAHITGTTIVDYQVEKGNEFIAKEKLGGQVELVKDNFEHSSFTDAHFDFVYALESACHAGGSSKELFVAEMARILKAGGRFCIADGFLKHDKKLPWLFNKIYRKIIDCWALPCFGNLDEFKSMLGKYGLTAIKTEEISMRIAPSVAYVPWTCIKFFATELWRKKSFKLKKERWNNVIAPLLGMILGLYRKHFGYFIISGTK